MIQYLILLGLKQASMFNVWSITSIYIRITYAYKHGDRCQTPGAQRTPMSSYICNQANLKTSGVVVVMVLIFDIR